MKYFIDTKFREEQGAIDLISIGIVSEYIKPNGCKNIIMNNTCKEYYAISKDFDIKKAWNVWQWEVKTDGTHKRIKVYWLRENVLKGIFKELSLKEYEPTNKYGKTVESTFGKLANEIIDKCIELGSFTYKNFKRLIKKYGKTNKQIAKEIEEFCKEKVNIKHNDFREYVYSKNDINKIHPKVATGYYENRSKPEFYGYYSAYDWVVLCWLFGRMIELPKGFPEYCNDLKSVLDRKQRLINKASASVARCIKDNPNYPKEVNAYNALDNAKWNKKLYEFINTI